ncbi:polysaccharide deacetylase family protein [Neobacillus drentensis]|uniref:polysaccharide deacetylase family protein n=1 Tax=Neobacillus drentensis TaxID=220684 RepID=UPI003000B4DE
MLDKKALIKKTLNYVKEYKYIGRYRAEKIIYNMERSNGENTYLTENLVPYINKSGVVLSFDDSFRVKHWYQYGKEIFGFYDVKATFNINAFHPFENNRMHTQEEIDMLLELQSNGHEIVHHGYKHRNAFQYSKNFGVNKWIEDDIIPLLDWMENQSHSKTGNKFKKPISFAFPGSAYDKKLTSAIIPQYFKATRGHLRDNNLATFGETGFIPSICIDQNYFFELKNIKKAIKIAKNAGKNLVLMCHSILPDECNWDDFGWGKDSEIAGKYRISPRVLKEIINEVKGNDMEFYTLAEVSGAATFIDRNLEKSIRDILSCQNEWVMIKDLVSLRELDLSNKGISNLDGIQYFLELESIDLRGNNIEDYRLLEKLPKLKRILM